MGEKLDKNECVSNFFTVEPFLQVKVDAKAQPKEESKSDLLHALDPEAPRELTGSSGLTEARFVHS